MVPEVFSQIQSFQQLNSSSASFPTACWSVCDLQSPAEGQPDWQPCDEAII